MTSDPSTDAPSAATDAELVLRVRSGDMAAYAEIVQRHQSAVWKMVIAMMRDGRTAENLVQQCFVDAYEDLHQYRPDLPLIVWLKAIARNLVRMEMRTRGRQSRLLDRYRDQMLVDTDANGRDPESEGTLVDALAACRQSLTPVAQQVLRLRYEVGLSLDQISAEVQRTVVATRQLLFRSRVALRECIEKKLTSA